MTTITLTMPDDMPVSELRQFALRNGCELRLKGATHYALVPRVVPMRRAEKSRADSTTGGKDES